MGVNELWSREPWAKKARSREHGRRKTVEFRDHWKFC